MRLNFLKGALTGLAIMTASAASAVTIDFTGFTSGAFVGVSKVYTTGMVSVTATAGTTSSPDGLTLVEATSPGATSANPGFYRGLGVRTTDVPAGELNSNESISFSIPAGFSVVGVTTTRTGLDTPQSFEALVDGFSLGVFSIAPNNNSMVDGRVTTALTPTSGSLFTITSADSNVNGVWVNSIEFEATATGVVPLPAGIVLLGGALVAGGVATRRKKA